jgi:hypothetical protein
MTGVRFPTGAEILFDTESRPALEPTQPRIKWVTGALSPGESGQDVKLTTHLNLVLTLTPRGAIPPLPQYAVMDYFILLYFTLLYWHIT